MSKPTPIRRNVALCYVRRSWVRDEKDLASSPQMQRDHIEKVCEQHGWIAEWYEDVEGHKSGMYEDNRPGWLALKSRLTDPDVVALVTYDLSRIHRKGWRISHLLDFVAQNGVSLVLASPTQALDLSTIQGRMFAQMAAVFDEFYAIDVSNRRKANAAHKKAQNKTVGIPPFGTVRNADGYLIPSTGGAWYLPNGLWVAGTAGEEPPEDGALWRGYYDCAKRILDLYVLGTGRATICTIMRQEGWAFRSIRNQPVPLSNDAIVRVTKNWIEYGGIVVGQRAKDRKSYEIDPDAVALDPERDSMSGFSEKLAGLPRCDRSSGPIVGTSSLRMSIRWLGSSTARIAIVSLRSLTIPTSARASSGKRRTSMGVGHTGIGLG